MRNKLPWPGTVDEALRYILRVATDKRSRLLLRDQCEWLETRLREIARLARRARSLRKKEGR